MADTTILVVDDEPQIRRVLRTTLSGNGYDVILRRTDKKPSKWLCASTPL